MREFCGLSAREIKKFFEEEGEKAFRSIQLFDWVYRKGVISYQEMLNIPEYLRDLLKEKISLGLLSLQKTESSKDGETVKFLWKLSDQRFVESVLISAGKRRTVCISSQVGCPGKCAFCASGKEGLIRNLNAAEMVEQVVLINRYLLQREERVSHIVFMGMGEPLENYDNVIRSLKIFIDPALFNFSPRKITVSTVGAVTNIKRLMQEGIKINLALSLHAPNQKIREKIIPYARKYSLEEVLTSVRNYAKYTKRDITYEYVILEKINGLKEHAEELAKLLKGEHCCVNLIPFNPVPGVQLKRPQEETVRIFGNILSKRGISNTRRYTKGKDIAAACGQLSLKSQGRISG